MVLIALPSSEKALFLGWEHIALTGDYVWTTSNTAPDFRSLRDVPSAFMPRAA
jgi:hypothetical protein